MTEDICEKNALYYCKETSQNETLITKDVPQAGRTIHLFKTETIYLVAVGLTHMREHCWHACL